MASSLIDADAAERVGPSCVDKVDSRRERLAVYRTPVPGGKIRRKRVGRARLLTLRQRLIEEVLGPPDSTRRHTERFEVAGGGELRVGWRGTSLDRRVAAFLVTSRSYSHRGVPSARERGRRGTGSARSGRSGCGGFRVLEARRFKRSRLLIGVRGGKIAWIAIADPRVFPAAAGAAADAAAARGLGRRNAGELQLQRRASKGAGSAVSPRTVIDDPRKRWVIEHSGRRPGCRGHWCRIAALIDHSGANPPEPASLGAGFVDVPRPRPERNDELRHLGQRHRRHGARDPDGGDRGQLGRPPGAERPRSPARITRAQSAPPTSPPRWPPMLMSGMPKVKRQVDDQEEADLGGDLVAARGRGR